MTVTAAVTIEQLAELRRGALRENLRLETANFSLALGTILDLAYRGLVGSEPSIYSDAIYYGPPTEVKS